MLTTYERVHVYLTADYFDTATSNALTVSYQLPGLFQRSPRRDDGWAGGTPPDLRPLIYPDDTIPQLPALVTLVTARIQHPQDLGVEVVRRVDVTKLRWENAEWRAEVRVREGGLHSGPLLGGTDLAGTNRP